MKMISQPKFASRPPSVKLALKRTVTICLCVLYLFQLPNVTNQQQQQQQQQRRQQQAHQAQAFQVSVPDFVGARDHYQLIGGGGGSEDDETNALIQQAATSSLGLADPNDASLLADLLDPFARPTLLASDKRAHLLQQQQQQSAHGGHSTPGHYEFEVAPKMEPPSAPKPPFKQATSSCPGSDLFGGFSPRHTLCGDLYQGKVPLNPMGQLVNDQAYPFELIKNKTLQFLARSLPILKSEYETIPKVGRYLPAQLLLNPTSHQSPLGHEHFHHLNKRSYEVGAAHFLAPPPPPFMRGPPHNQRGRRHKRQTSSSSPSSSQVESASQATAKRSQHRASITVADFTPNATLVVSSAHSSSAGRIGAHLAQQQQHPQNQRQIGMVTKDGYRPHYGASVTQVAYVPPSDDDDNDEDLASASAALSPVSVAAPPIQVVLQSQAIIKDNANARPSLILKSHAASAASEQISSSGQQQHGQQQQAANVGRQEGQTNLLSAKTAVAAASSSQDQTQVQARSTGGESGGHQQQQKGAGEPSGGRATAAQSSSSPPVANTSGSSNNNGGSGAQLSERTNSQQQQQQQQPHGHVNGASVGQRATGKQNNGRSSGSNSPMSRQQQQQQAKCANVNGFLMSTVCHATLALMEPADTSGPDWLKTAVKIGKLYSVATDSGGGGSSGISGISSSLAQSNPLLDLWNSWSGSQSAGQSTSGSSGSSSSSDGDERRQDQDLSDLTYKTAGGQHQGKAAGSSMEGIISLIQPLFSFFGPSQLRTGGDHNSAPTTSSSSSSVKQDRIGARNQSSSLSSGNRGASGTLSSGLKAVSNLMFLGLSLAGLDYMLGSSSSLFAPPTPTTFARRKSGGDSFADTALSALSKQPAAISSSGSAGSSSNNNNNNNKQPPTPCPSVEEYISPTFARNYQGQWKYVVQIPHEGYFTQTIQRSSCVRQKCEFTQGVCHEAPRWVSLLVAEIYYPNTVFGNPAQQQQQQQLGVGVGSTPNPLDELSQRIALDGGAIPNAALLSQLMNASPSNSHLQQVAFGNQFGGQQQHPQQQQQQPKSLAMPNGAQDPLQMTDSLNTYNHNNLNNIFFGLDPTNIAQMQQLANAHNHQLMQRDGLVPHVAMSNQQQQKQQQQVLVAESRAAPQQSSAGNSMTPNQKQMRPQQVQRRQEQQSQQQLFELQQQQRQQQLQLQQQQLQQQQQPVFDPEYIKALALETIRRNPHLTIDELIKSLQMQQARKKRDLSQLDQQQQQQAQMLSAANGQQELAAHFDQDQAAMLQQRQNQQLNVHMSQHAPSRRSSAASSLPQFNPAQADHQLPSVNELSSAAAHSAQQQAFDLAGLPGQMSMQQQQQQQAALINNNNQQQTRQALPANAAQITASQATLMSDNLSGTVDRQQQAISNQQDGSTTQTAATTTTTGPGQLASGTGSPDSQVECDGHDKVGCYVVRVYYDWFLVNGSCKCWKTNNSGQPASSSSSSGGSGGSGGTSGGSSGSLIRRIFTG